MDTRLTWVRTPRQLGGDVRRWAYRMLDALYDLGVYWAGRFETYMRENARWTDRTGMARKGLRAQAVRMGAIVFIYLYHRVAYGWWLEVARAGKYAILMPTVQRFFAEIMASMQRLGAR